MDRKYFRAVVGAMILVGCHGEGDLVVHVPRPLTAKITPGSAAAGLCQILPVSVSVTDFNLATVIPDSMHWAVSDSTAVTIAPNGAFHTHLKSVAADTLRVTIFAEAQTASAQAVWIVQDDGVLVIGPDGKPVPHQPCPSGW